MRSGEGVALNKLMLHPTPFWTCISKNYFVLCCIVFTIYNYKINTFLGSQFNYNLVHFEGIFFFKP